MQLRVPIRATVVDDLFQDILECFIRRLHETIGLWIMQHAFLMNYCVMFGEILDDRIQKMASLIADELDRTTKTTPNVLIQEFGQGSCSVVAQRFCLYPFRTIVRGHSDIFITCCQS